MKGSERSLLIYMFYADTPACFLFCVVNGTMDTASRTWESIALMPSLFLFAKK